MGSNFCRAAIYVSLRVGPGRLSLTPLSRPPYPSDPSSSGSPWGEGILARLPKDEKVECVDNRTGFRSCGAAEPVQTGGVLVVGDQL